MAFPETIRQQVAALPMDERKALVFEIGFDLRMEHERRHLETLLADRKASRQKAAS